MRLAHVEEKIEATRVSEIIAGIADGTMSKGAGIREMFAGGHDVKEISQITGIKYNHVYNVVQNEVLKHGLEVEKGTRGGENSKKAAILELLASGKSITEVARECQCIYNYVWQIAKAAGYTGQKKAEPEVVEEKPAKRTRTKKEA